MKIKWLGHSCFLITSDSKLKIIMDPYNTGGGLSYGAVKEAADIVTISHEHPDHNNARSISGNPELVKGSGEKQVKGISIRGIPVYHDESQGRQRGTNTIFCLTVDSMRLCHLGDLGHELDKEQIKEIGPVDILMIPIGGFFTIDAATATKVSRAINPQVILPMHYKTPKCDYPITGLEEFLKGKTRIQRIDGSEAEFKAGQFSPGTEIVVLQNAL
jgi:L-ascorbate metabolism protein UlaG (beta-lactamase superfamily)